MIPKLSFEVRECRLDHVIETSSKGEDHLNPQIQTKKALGLGILVSITADHNSHDSL